MTAGTAITPAELRQLLDYNPETGALTWKLRRRNPAVHLREHERWNSRHAGTSAGYVGAWGYIIVKVYRNAFKAHRLAWAIYHGAWPSPGLFIDHINRDKADNRIINLRLATRSENGLNRPNPANNTSGMKGVYWASRNGKWAATIGIDNAKHRLGYFTSYEAACAAYVKAARQLYGDFAHIDTSR